MTPPAKDRCKAKTAKGKQCKRRAVRDSGFCENPRHAELAAKVPKKRGPKKGEGGRHPVVWTTAQWSQFEHACRAGARAVDIAEMMGVDVNTIDAICQRERGQTFSAFRGKKKGWARAALAAKQIEMALAGDRTMLVWLGKQFLGQTDKPEDVSPAQQTFNLIIGSPRQEEPEDPSASNTGGDSEGE